VRYGALTAVREVTLSARPGEIVGIVGTNGAGKSSLLRAIVGLTPLAGGECSLGAVDLRRMATPDRARAGLGFVPEGRRLFGALTVRENLILGALAARIEAPAAALDRQLHGFPELKRLLDNPAESLSGGEQQMVAIARALIQDPSVVMMDEPSLGLAPVVVGKVATLTKDIARAGRTVVLAEQNIELALKCADRIYVLQFGEVKALLEASSGDLDAQVDGSRESWRKQIFDALLGAAG
jgi:branched-chain amino acid transport system ATP-binding protein